MEPTRLFVLHRFELLAETLRIALHRHRLVTWIDSANEVRWAIDRLRHLRIDVLLLDARLARDETDPAIRRLKEASPDLKILTIGLDDDHEILEFLDAGASGYVPSAASLEDLVQTLRAVHLGDPRCSARLAASVLARIADLSRQARQRRVRRLSRDVRFTPRELEILSLLADGLRNKEIARRLFIALPTVKIHVHRILKKMRVRSRGEAARLALEAGLVGEPRAVSKPASPSTGLPDPGGRDD